MGIPLTEAGRERFRGVFSLLLTPFLSNGEIDWQAYDVYVDWQLSTSPHGLFAVCGTSEMSCLTEEERLKLAARAVQRAGNIPVTATANVNDDPLLHREELKRMEETGVSGVVLVPPPAGIGSDPQQKFEYYAQLSQASSLPVFIYEWPHRDNHLIDSKLYGELVRQAGIEGIKDTTCTVEGIRSKIVEAPESIVYQANMAFMLEALELGAGIECIHSAAASQMVVDLWESAVRGDQARTQALHARLVFLNGVLNSFHPTAAKYLAQLQGQPMQLTCRATDKGLTKERMKAIEVFLRYCQMQEQEYGGESHVL